MHRWLLLSTLWIAACRAPPTTLLVVLADQDGGQSPIATDALVAALQTVPHLRLLRGNEGCRRPGASHSLRVSRQQTGTSVIAAATLERCADGVQWVQNFVQPRASAVDPGRAMAHWVTRQLAVDPAAR